MADLPPATHQPSGPDGRAIFELTEIERLMGSRQSAGVASSGPLQRLSTTW